MRRIVRIAFTASVALAVGMAVRWLLKRGASTDRQLPPPAPTDDHVANRNGAVRARGAGPTRDQLYREAQRLEVRGRSKMKKQELQEAVEAAKTGGSS